MKLNKSAGILLYRFVEKKVEVLLAHPGGPFWKNKDIGAWSIPKGEFTDEEDPFSAALREFTEEIGTAPDCNFMQLVPVKLKSGKTVHAFACNHDLDVTNISSNNFEMEWPPKSGKMQSFPEIDRAEWFTIATALNKINPGQADLVLQLLAILKNN